MSEFATHPIDAVKHGGRRTKLLAAGGGVVVAGVVVMRVRAARADSTDTTDTTDSTDTTDPTTAGTYDDTGDYGLSSSGYGTDSGYSSPVASEYGYTNPQGDTITNGSTETITGPSTNPAWTQEVVSYLTAQGYDADTVLAALGAYENKHGLTTAQYHIIEAAIAAEGRPPVYPGAPIHASNTGQNGGQTKTPPKKTTPKPKPSGGKNTTHGSHSTTPARHGRKPVTHGGGKVGRPILDPTRTPTRKTVLEPIGKKTKASTPKRKAHR